MAIDIMYPATILTQIRGHVENSKPYLEPKDIARRIIEDGGLEVGRVIGDDDKVVSIHMVDKYRGLTIIVFKDAITVSHYDGYEEVKAEYRWSNTAETGWPYILFKGILDYMDELYDTLM